MLVTATKEDIEQYMEFAYSLAMDQTKSGYRLFSDGVSTKDQFIDHVWKGYQQGDQELLLFISEGNVEGWIQFYFIEKDRYLQTTGFLTNRNTEQALAEFIEYTREHFAGYKLYLGFPKKNSRATAFLQKSGARLVEEAYHDIFLLEDSKLPPVPNGLVRVTESNFSEFREIHQTEPDTYWNSDRMYAALDKWIIYLLYREEKAVGYLCARDGEIYHLGYRDRSFDPEVYKALVAKILQDFKKVGYPYLIFFNEEESQATALELGFSCVSEYVLYIR